MPEEENIITYETFRKFQRNERENQELQELPEDFYKSCNTWIKRKNEMYEKTKDTMILKEIENVMSIIKDILDRRERKLILMAIQTVRSKAPPRNLLPYEIDHFDTIVKQLKNMREGILKIISGETNPPKNEPDEPRKQPESIKNKSEDNDIPKNEEPTIDKEKYIEEIKESVKEKEKLKEIEKFKLVKILDNIPQFLGTDGKVYGPLEKDDLITLENKIADLLVSKNKAEYIEI